MTCGGWSVRDQNIERRGSRWWLRCLQSPVGVGLLLVGLIFFHLIGHHIVRKGLGYVYTPPALSPEKAAVYSRYVEFIRLRPEYRRAHLDMYRGMWEEIDNSVTGQAASSNGATTNELFSISRDFKQVNCLRAEMRDWYIVFLPKPSYILPTSPGVLYSLDGQNPNDVEDKYLNNKRPFMHIKGRWYMSRGLAISPLPMTAGDWRLPAWSVIDRSLQDPGLVPQGGEE